MKEYQKEIKIVIELGGKRVSLDKGSETIALDISEDNTVHIWATHRNGAWTVTTLKFLEDEVIQVE